MCVLRDRPFSGKETDQCVTSQISVWHHRTIHDITDRCMTSQTDAWQHRFDSLSWQKLLRDPNINTVSLRRAVVSRKSPNDAPWEKLSLGLSRPTSAPLLTAIQGTCTTPDSYPGHLRGTCTTLDSYSVRYSKLLLQIRVQGTHSKVLHASFEEGVWILHIRCDGCLEYAWKNFQLMTGRGHRCDLALIAGIRYQLQNYIPLNLKFIYMITPTFSIITSWKDEGCRIASG